LVEQRRESEEEAVFYRQQLENSNAERARLMDELLKARQQLRKP
jgi:hypothetical protein